MIFPAKFGLPALALEMAAWGQFVLNSDSNSEQQLLSYFIMHGAASILLALLAFSLLPRRYKRPRGAVLGLLFSPIFFIPLLGFIGIIVAAIAPALLPRFTPSKRFDFVSMPPADPHERMPHSTFSKAGARSFLGNSNAPVELRLRALVGLQNIPSRVSSPLLRDLLADPAEDIRLLAYGMLDTQEKRLNSRIHDALHLFNNAPNGDIRIQAAKKLSQLFWELVYQGLAQGDLARHALEQSLHFAKLALEVFPDDAALYLLHGRLLHEQGHADDTRTAYDRALALGLPRTRVIPYLAELAFEQRNFDEVRRLIPALQDWQSLSRLQPVIRFWSKENI